MTYRDWNQPSSFQTCSPLLAGLSMKKKKLNQAFTINLYQSLFDVSWNRLNWKAETWFKIEAY